MYRVKVGFADLKDGRHFYKAGESYPRPGLTATPERIAELAGSDNRMGYALIEAVDSPVEAAHTEARETPEKADKPAQKRPGRRKKVTEE